MSKIYPLLVGMLLAFAPGWLYAQQQQQPAAVPASPAAPPLATPLAVPDTAAALHRLFALRRHRGHATLKVGGAVLVVSSIALGIGAHESGYQALGISLTGLLGIAGSVPVLATGVIRTVTYSKKQEQRIVQAWQQHRLSRHLKRALENDSLLATQAQARAAALAALSPVVATAAARDTAAALHRLFATRRRIIKVVLPLTIAAGAGLVSVGSPLPGTATLVLAAAELAALRKYTKKREALALLAFKEHRLPATQRQELKAEYFRRAKAAP